MICKQAKERTPRTAKRAKVVVDEDEDDLEEAVEESEEESEGGDELFESDSDDLFDDDELEEIDRSTKRTEPASKARGKQAPATRAGRLAKSMAKGKSALEAYGDEQDEEEDEEDEEESDDEGRRGRGKKSKAAAKREGVKKKAGARSRLSEMDEAYGEVEEAGESGDDDDNSAAAANVKKKNFMEEADDEGAEASPPAELEEYQRLQSRRMYLEKWINEPYFEDVVKGSYVRFHVGQSGGQAVYRMALVQDIQDAKRPYKMPGTEVLVDKQFVLAIAESVKVGRLDKVSNSRITESELKQYLAKMRESGLENKLLTKKVK
jgi:RNA polymerase-associated protein RTF1